MAGAARDEFELKLGWPSSEDRDDDVAPPEPSDPPATRDTLPSLTGLNPSTAATVDATTDADDAAAPLMTSVDPDLGRRVDDVVVGLDEATRAVADVAFRISAFTEDLRRLADRIDTVDRHVTESSIERRLVELEDVTEKLEKKLSLLTLQMASVPNKIRDLDRALIDRAEKFEDHIVARLETFRGDTERRENEIREINQAIGELTRVQERMQRDLLSATETRAAAKRVPKAVENPEGVVARARRAAGPKPKPAGSTVSREASGTAASRLRSWVEPVGGVCPTGHPVKASLVERLFRLPGAADYDTAAADRCYASATAARRGGFSEATD